MVAIFAALALAWLAMTWLFERHIERREAAELRRSALVLVEGLGIKPDGGPRADRHPTDPRFEGPASGLYWQVSTPQDAVRSRSLWDQTLSSPKSAPAETWRTRVGPGPYGDRLLLVERSVRPDRSGAAVLVQVAADEKDLAAARREFGRDLALFLGGLWAVLSLAALVQVRLGLRPLSRLREELRRLRRNPSARLSLEHPREIEPLIGAINALAQAREGDLERARRRASDLAHSLKTPLAALAAQSRRARADGASDAADGLDRAIAAVGAALETELARARAAAMRETTGEAEAAPAAIAERLIGVVERTDDGAKLIFDQAIPEDFRLPAPEEAVTEILGALIENAARFARRLVRISVVESAEAVGVAIDDDGPGIEDGRAEAALLRGGRLDEAGAGHGLGLAIVRDLTEATEGEINLGRSPMQGLRVVVSWPRDRA
ncbi:MAG: HAMP domain-containing histidine kinase [Phenylobacterium sp.]|nr:HAMP domain-containing histidine kinase [Phenylobacterium sp.]